MQDWKVNVQSSIPNNETLDIKSSKKVQRYELKRIDISY